MIISKKSQNYKFFYYFKFYGWISSKLALLQLDKKSLFRADKELSTNNFFPVFLSIIRLQFPCVSGLFPKH